MQITIGKKEALGIIILFIIGIATGLAANNPEIISFQGPPNPSHGAGQITAGSFTIGDYTFPTGSRLGIGAAPTTAELEVTGDITATGTISAGGALTANDLSCTDCIGATEIDNSIQEVLTGNCNGQVMVGIAADGTVNCETDDNGGTATNITCNNCIDLTQIDQTIIQQRVTGNCPAGSSIRTINQDGTVNCEVDDDGGTATNITCNDCIDLTQIDQTIIQQRVTGNCNGQVVVGVNEDGTVSCEADDTGAGGDSDWTVNGNDMESAVSGNVGIGASPSRKLEVSGSGDQYIRATSTDNSDVGVELYRPGNTRTDWRMVNIGGKLQFQFSEDDFSTATTTMTIVKRGFFYDSVGIGTTNPQSRFHVEGASGNNPIGYFENSARAFSSIALKAKNTATNCNHGVAIFGHSLGGIGVFGRSDGEAEYDVDGDLSNSVGVYGLNTEGGYGGYFESRSGTGLYTTSCSGCSVIAEMAQVAETPNNGDVMCMNPQTGSTEICREDKSSYVKGIAQEKAEILMRTGCADTLKSEGGKNGLGLGIIGVDKWREKPECNGWYPIALSGVSEGTNVVCATPDGRALRYGDILVTSSTTGHLRPLDEDEDAKAYQMVGRADSICTPGKITDSIMVWIQ